MIRPPPRSKLTDTLLPDTTLFRSVHVRTRDGEDQEGGKHRQAKCRRLPVHPIDAHHANPGDGQEKHPAEQGQQPAFRPEEQVHVVDGHLRWADDAILVNPDRSEEHTSELQSLMRISYAVFCLKKKKKHIQITTPTETIKEIQ